MNTLGNPTRDETVAYFERLLKERDRKISHLEYQVKKQSAKNLIRLLDELCANAEPVCDCLEMGQSLKSPKTLSNFRKALNDGWAAIRTI